nr:elongation factor G, III-V domain-containing protein [Tanacetum cinerariifolium]
MNNNDDRGYEEHDVDEDDLEEDSERELDAMIETFYPNQDEEVALGIESVRKHYRILQQIREPTTNEPEKEVKHGDEEADNSWNENENYLDYFDLESLHKDVLEDGSIELRRTPMRFLRYKENSGLNASSRVRVKCIDEHCKWMVYAANELHDGKKYFLVKKLHEKHTCSKMFKISHIKAPWIVDEFKAMIYAHPGLDGCFLKGVVKAMLLTVVEHLKVDIMTPDGKEWEFMFDKQKLDFRGEKLKVAFYSVAKCADEEQIQQQLDGTDNIKDGVKRSLEDKDIKQWCRALFKSSSKCDSLDDNNTKAWNFVLVLEAMLGRPKKARRKRKPHSRGGELLPPLRQCQADQRKQEEEGTYGPHSWGGELLPPLRQCHADQRKQEEEEGKLEIPENLYDCINQALEAEQKLKRCTSEEGLLKQLNYLKEMIGSLAEFYKEIGLLPSDWEYHRDSASSYVPKCPLVSAKKKPKKNIPRTHFHLFGLLSFMLPAK